MVIIDFSQIAVSSYMVIASKSFEKTVDIELIRLICLDSIRYAIGKFKREYGYNIVLAIDSSPSWRKQVWPYYKAHRKDDRNKSGVDWNELFGVLETVKKEIIEIFPYKVIEVAGAEADDIIGVLARDCVSKEEPCLILSGDGDFIQLQLDNDLVRQWDKVHERWMHSAEPKKYLFEHVLRGDKGDGIPNILSPEDSYVTKTRCKALTQKKLDALWENPNELRTNDRFRTNLKLIDLRYTPKPLQEEILDKYNTYETNERRDLFNYFVSKGLKRLMKNIGDF